MHDKAAHFTGDLHLPCTAESVNGCFVTVREEAVGALAPPRRLDSQQPVKGNKKNHNMNSFSVVVQWLEPDVLISIPTLD